MAPVKTGQKTEASHPHGGGRRWQDSARESIGDRCVPKEVSKHLERSGAARDNHSRVSSLSVTDRQDKVLCQQLEEQFLDGLSVASGQYLVAAFLYSSLSLRSPSMQLLPRVKQALAGWKRLAPLQARMPIPYEVVALMPF